jgi:glycosyltransferase involved in cell wall biosynthesis
MEYSVIIPTHNRPELVVRAIRSVYAQSCPAREVLVIDDASEPALTLPEDLRDGRTRVIRRERAGGGAAARNTGLNEAAGEIVAFLDDDDEWLPRKMEIQLAWLAEHPRATLVTCGHLRCEGGREYLEMFTQDFVERYRQYDNFFGSFSYLVIRRTLAGVLLDPALPALQDWDFALRATRGNGFGVIEEALVKYYAHDLPRITNGRGNHLRGLRHCYLTHRSHFPEDARRWLMGRVIFERSKGIASRRKRLGRVGFSIAVAAGCHVPLGMKLRVIGRRAASLGISPGRVVAIRSAAIATWQGVRNYFSVGRVGRETGAQGFTSR